MRPGFNTKIRIVKGGSLLCRGSQWGSTAGELACIVRRDFRVLPLCYDPTLAGTIECGEERRSTFVRTLSLELGFESGKFKKRKWLCTRLDTDERQRRKRNVCLFVGLTELSTMVKRNNNNTYC